MTYFPGRRGSPLWGPNGDLRPDRVWLSWFYQFVLNRLSFLATFLNRLGFCVKCLNRVSKIGLFFWGVGPHLTTQGYIEYSHQAYFKSYSWFSEATKWNSVQSFALLNSKDISDVTYITCKKLRTFYFGWLIFGHILSQLGQISDKDFGNLAETLLRQIYAYKTRIRLGKRAKKIVFLHP